MSKAKKAKQEGEGGGSEGKRGTRRREAKRRGYDGVVCGHIHKAELRTINGITYANDGDWVESLTALAENHDGSLEILDYSKNFETLHLKKYDKKQLISSM